MKNLSRPINTNKKREINLTDNKNNDMTYLKNLKI